MKSEIAQTKKGTIEYTSLGSGPTILVSHGTSTDCFSTTLVDPLVKSGFRVVTPSRPGYGRTPAEVGTTAREAAEAMLAFLDTLGVETCVLIAISGGGPTGETLAALNPARFSKLVLAAAISHTEGRQQESSYKAQQTFYGPIHGLIWGGLGLMSRISPRSIAKQTLTIFSTYDPAEGLSKLSPEDIQVICRFYQGHSSRKGALLDFNHTVDENLLGGISLPTLVIHSRYDNSVPFSHAEWSLSHIPNARLCEGGITGHFFWVGPDKERINRDLIAFLKDK
jgi:pimeloyl-ACP methyl ester carboxylesterase